MNGADSNTLVHILYIALFGRPADPVGLKTWTALINKSPAGAAEAAAALQAADEAYAMFGGYTSLQKVDILFTNMFGHVPGEPARSQLAAQLDQGTAGIGGLVELATTVVSAADIAALEAKVAAAKAFVGALDNTVELLSYQGERAHDIAHDFLAKVVDAASLAQHASAAAVDAVVAQIVGMGPVPVADVIHTQVQEMYVAFFGRAADKPGLGYWTALFNGVPSDATQNVVASAFGLAHEYQALFAGKTPSQVVATVYENLFGRAGEPAGIAYWSALLEKGVIAVHNVVKAVAEGARGSDLYAFDAKVKVAAAISTAMDTEIEIQSYAGLERSKIVRDYIASVKDPATYAAAIDPKAIDKLVEVIVTGSGQWDYPAPQAELASLVGVAPVDGVML